MPATQAEEARAQMLELFPEGFEEVECRAAVELVAYTDRAGEELLSRRFGAVSASDVEPCWEDRWQEFHQPVRVGRLWIGQSWQPRPTDGIEVVIDPGRAFGTGAHPSTRLCLELLQRVSPGKLLDAGCGSGVIAIAAAKLGFTPVFAVDTDPHAVEATTRNAASNDVDVDVGLADAVTADLPAADLAVVNMTLELVEAVTARLNCRLVIAAGYLRGDVLRVPNHRRVERVEEDGWAADLLERLAQ